MTVPSIIKASSLPNNRVDIASSSNLFRLKNWTFHNWVNFNAKPNVAYYLGDSIGISKNFI